MQTIIGSAVKDSKSERFRDIRLPGLFMLAIAATGTAIFMSVLAGWQRGGRLSERLVWCAISVVLVLCAHLVPALCRDASAVVRYIGGGLWAACMIAVACGHATFFLLSQQHAGERRADSIAVVVSSAGRAAPPGRSLTAIAAEQATFKAALGAVSGQSCSRGCAALHAKRIALSARLDALDVEADEAKRWERDEDRTVAQADRMTTLRDAMRDDPVTTRLAALARMTPEKTNLLLALAFAIELEGMACLCWYVALRLRNSQGASASFAVTQEVARSVSASHAAVTLSDMTLGEPNTAHAPNTEIDGSLLQLRRDVAAGRIRATVADIRRHLGCSQAKAAALRRQIGELQTSSGCADGLLDTAKGSVGTGLSGQ